MTQHFDLAALDGEELVQTYTQLMRLVRHNTPRRLRLARVLCDLAPAFQCEVDVRMGKFSPPVDFDFRTLQTLDDIGLALLGRTCTTAQAELRARGFAGTWWLDLRDAVIDEEVRRFFIEPETQRSDNVL